ncbi:MAG: hypothetical protein ABS79_00985 [Planctomycetes bacterium SCN 63-9]|nr:MAG: hypothetical protein ABS79_00985 [Planctomycetes bacterium SCN 63-9]
MRTLSPLLILACLISAAPSPPSDFPGRVVGVSDGDTVTVLTGAKQQVRVRLWGIDAPESGQDFGQRAKQAASDLAFGRQVTVKVHTTDRYGRTVAEIILPDGRSLNRELVRSGWAWWYRQYAPADRELASLEAEAKAAKRGLWSGPNPVAPWEWRRGGEAVVGSGVIGNKNSRIYHTPNCRSVARMKEVNRVAFGSAVEAEGKGYRKAGDCK